MDYIHKVDLHRQPKEFIGLYLLYNLFAVLNSACYLIFYVLAGAILIMITEANANGVFWTPTNMLPVQILEYDVIYIAILRCGVITSIQKWIEKKAEEIPEVI